MVIRRRHLSLLYLIIDNQATSSRLSTGSVSAAVLIALLSSMILAAFPLASAATTSSLGIVSQNTSGVTVTGFRTVLYSSTGGILSEDFTPSTFTTTIGQTYGVRAESYGSCTFVHWSDGVTTDPRSYTPTNATFGFTAVYSCTPTTTGSSVAVSSVNQAGASLSNLVVNLLASNGSLEVTGHTPVTFTTVVGQVYQIQAEGNATCTFAKWSDGVASDPRPFTAATAPSSYTADYSCAVQTTSSVYIGSVNGAGSAITGFRTILYNSAGAIVDEGFTPSSFTTTVGQTYSVRAESYGNCTFTSWQDGSATDPRSFVATTSTTTLTASYDCTSGSDVSVGSVNQADQAITGYTVTLTLGSVVSTGSTPATFPTVVGDSYQLKATNTGGSCSFTGWSDGVTSNPRTFSPVSSTPVAFTADYSCPIAPQPSSVTVDSVNQGGVAVSGFRTVLYSSTGGVISEGFSPNTFATTSGQTYGVRAESYGSCTFTKWSDGVTSDPRTFTSAVTPATFTAVYDCVTTPTMYDEQLGLTFTQNYTSLTENVTAVAQTDSDGFGPAYLLNGLTNTGYWYQIGIGYDWPGASTGFVLLYEVWAPGDTSVFPSGSGAGSSLLSGPVNSNDTVELSLTFSGNTVTMAAKDLTTGSQGSESFSAEGGNVFIGLNATSNNNGYFSGLMTEQYHSAQYSGGETPVTYWSNVSRTSAWMWADELKATSTGSTAVWQAAGFVRYTTQNPVWTLSSNGAEEMSEASVFVTGLD
jgi:hypothetical protein